MPPPFRVVLVEPEIPENTGTIARLCVATRAELHLVGRLGFQLNHRRLKRAGLDYWEHVRLSRHIDFAACREQAPDAEVHFFSARASRPFTEARIPPGALLTFGSETRGLPSDLLTQTDRCWRIPIFDDRVRSLNLACAVAIVLYEAIRQNDATPIPDVNERDHAT